MVLRTRKPNYKSFSTQLATEKISLFGFFRRLRDPGDDRLITIQVQLNNYYTIMESTANVYTETPRIQTTLGYGHKMGKIIKYLYNPIYS